MEPNNVSEWLIFRNTFHFQQLPTCNNGQQMHEKKKNLTNLQCWHYSSGGHCVPG